MPIFTLSSSCSFADTLAEWVMAQYSKENTGVSDVLLLLPSRRAIRSVQEAFLRASGGRALLLPQMQTLGDLSEKALLRYAGTAALPVIEQWGAVMDEYPRLLKLAQLVAAAHDGGISSGQALQLADTLAGLLDEFQREQIDPTALDSLVPAELANQWQETLAFLKIIREQWPEIVREGGQVDPWQRSNEALQMLAESWRAAPPDYPVIAAGTTGSIPATAALLKVISELPQGGVILPGLDNILSDAAWEALDETHPQYGLKQLLAGIGKERDQVESLKPLPATARESWLSIALQPAETVDTWQGLELDTLAALKGCHYLPCRDDSEEVKVAGLLMREALETPGMTAALVTPDRRLARRVRAQLRRWGIEADDSAGTPLDQLPAGVFLLLLLQCVSEQNAPVALLSLLKHPLMRLGRSAAEIRGLARLLEKEFLRGLKPQSLVALQQAVRDDYPKIYALLRDFEYVVEPLARHSAPYAPIVSLPVLLDSLLTAAHTLSSDGEGGVLLQEGEEAPELMKLLEELQIAAEHSPPIPAGDLKGMLQFLLGRTVYRNSWQGHPRLQILSPIEARMQSADRMILAGLNEGTWPAIAEPDPWLSRPMRQSLGLPTPERRIGQAAHDFVQLAAAPEVYLVRSEKSGGAETVASRYLQRMQTVLQLAGGDWQPEAWQEVVRRSNLTEQHPALLAPQPRPPVSARPRELPVTSIEKLLKDPYGIYARKILDLRRLEPLQQLPQVREFGTAVHEALEKFLLAGGMQSPDPQAALRAQGRAAFAPYGDAFMVESLWWPRFEQIAEWLLKQEWSADNRCEIKGEWRFPLPGGDFTLTARVDRIDIQPEGLVLIDYKTGAPPQKKDIKRGHASQLTLTAVMLGKSAFGAELSERPVMRIEYWKLAGGVVGGEITAEALTEPEIEATEAQLNELLAAYDDPSMPYLAVPNRSLEHRYNDYEHLERIAEWD